MSACSSIQKNFYQLGRRYLPVINFAPSPLFCCRVFWSWCVWLLISTLRIHFHPEFCFSLLFRVSKPPIPIQTLLSFYFLTSIPSILALDFGSRGWFLMQQQFQSDCRLQGLDSVVDSLESLFFYLFFIFWRKRRCSCGSVSRFSSEWLVMILIMI